MESVQKYNSGGWNYMDELKAFVDGGFSDPGFINAVSGIVNRGCHNPVRHLEKNTFSIIMTICAYVSFIRFCFSHVARGQ
jgi:hypothetical protein